MDPRSRLRWERCAKAAAPCYVVEGKGKTRERPTCLAHILSKIPHREIPPEKPVLPQREVTPDDAPKTLPVDLDGPKGY